jgi:DNA helicase-2/ATP-dependent DNA helicase PcrA
MPSNNRIVIAAAGSGKTTSIIRDAYDAAGQPSALITYTIENSSEIRSKTYEEFGFIPENFTIGTWYAFLLRHFVRPYQNSLYKDRRIAKLCFVNSRSAPYSKATNIRAHYIARPDEIFSDKVTKFACEAIARTGGLPLRRIEQIFRRIYIDESQDLAGYDLDFIELLMKSKVSVILVADPRQAVYSTNSAARNSPYAGANVAKKFKEWRDAGLCELEYQYLSNRCAQAICDFADEMFPELHRTVSLNETITGHDGVFAVRKSAVGAYMEAFHPQTLRYSRATKNVPGSPINFGKAKGLTFDRCLIFPHKAFEEFTLTGKPMETGLSLAKSYVASTRARQSTAIVIPDNKTPRHIPLYETAPATPRQH